MQQDTFTARVATVALAVATLALIGGCIYLAARELDIPAELAGPLGLALGALLPSPVTKAGPPAPDVNVNQVAADPEVTARAVAAKLQAPRGRGQKGEAGCATLFILALAAIGVVALLVWVFS